MNKSFLQLEIKCWELNNKTNKNIQLLTDRCTRSLKITVQWEESAAETIFNESHKINHQEQLKTAQNHRQSPQHKK